MCILSYYRCHTVVVINHRMHSFGLGIEGQLGLKSTRNAATPRPVPDSSDVIAVYAGGDRTFFLQASGVAVSYCFVAQSQYFSLTNKK